MNTTERSSQPVNVEPVRPDVELFESDAGPGEIALVIRHRGYRKLRMELDEDIYSPELAAEILRLIEGRLPPLISIVREASLPPRPA